MKLLCAAGLMTSSLACSLVFVSAPPDAPPPPPARARCTTTPIAPAIDTAIAILGLVGAGYFIGIGSDDNLTSVGVVIESGIALGFGTSAFFGWRRVTRCERLQRQAAP